MRKKIFAKPLPEPRVVLEPRIPEGATRAAEVIKCPRNPDHHIPQNLLSQHMENCAKVLLEQQHLTRVCPFNAAHVIFEKQLRKHKKTCPDKNLGESVIEENCNVTTTDFGPSKNSKVMMLELAKIVNHVASPIKIEEPVPFTAVRSFIWQQIEDERLKRLRKGIEFGHLIYPLPNNEVFSLNYILFEENWNRVDSDVYKLCSKELSLLGLAAVLDPKEMANKNANERRRLETKLSKINFLKLMTGDESFELARSVVDPLGKATADLSKVSLR